MNDFRRIAVTDLGHTAVVWFLDSAIQSAKLVREAGDELFALVQDSRFHTVVFNFRGVEWMSSEFLTRLMIAVRRVQRRGGRTRYQHLRREIVQLIDAPSWP